MTERKIPVGIQSFEKLREDNFIYVDKTEYIYKMVHNNVPYFFSRPRRFGKSLLVSTLKAYWEGRRDLFEGLKIEELERDNKQAWKEYPVFYFDFNGEDYYNTSIEEVLEQHLGEWESVYGNQYKDGTLGYRFQKLLEMASKKYGRRCVVLVDEYDKPLLEVLEDDNLEEHTKKVFKGFFSRLKKADEYIQFILITGVSKFHKVSIFSDLNQLNDISLSEEYASLCGITKKEIEGYFSIEVEELATKHKLNYDECMEKLRIQYDGYKFYQNGEGVYNPYSLLNCFSQKEFNSYWFETGTPTFLIKKLRNNYFDIRKFTDRTIYASETVLKDYTGEGADSIPLLYQTGYLTIVDYDSRLKRFTLSFPNEEVKYGFLESLMPSYVPKANGSNGLDIYTLESYVEDANIEGIKNIFIALFANITYTNENDPFEHYFQSIIYVVFTLLGKFALCEMHTFSGRIDCKVETAKYIYLFEFKRDKSADEAINQINSKEYELSFVADKRKVFKIGVSFDSTTRKLSEWKIDS